MTARRWRFYATAAGRSPVREFLDTLSDAQAAQMLAAMRVVAVSGLVEARHLRGDVYEVRASIGGQAFRVLFASEGRRGQVLLALEDSRRSRSGRRLGRSRWRRRGLPIGGAGLVRDLLLDISFLRCHDLR